MAWSHALPAFALFAACAAPAARASSDCPGVPDPVAAAERAERVLLVRAAPLTEPREIETVEDLRALTRPAREDRTGPAPAPAETDGRTFRMMSVVSGAAPDDAIIRLAAPALGCPAPDVGREYLLMLGPGSAAAAMPVSGPDDPLVARVRQAIR